MGKKIANTLSEEEIASKNSSVKKRRIIYLCGWFVFLIFYLVAGIMGSGFEDEYDSIINIMWFVVPVVTLLIGFAYFLRYDAARTTGRFVMGGTVLVLMISYIGEALTVIIGFGLDTPQYKLLYSFALGFAIFTAVLGLFMYGFYGKAIGVKKR